MRKPMIAGNWKMNMMIGDLEGYMRAFLSGIEKVSAVDQVDICFSTPFLQLAEAQKILTKTPILVAAQNVHFENAGAFTGEISLPMLTEVGVKTVIVGHSERRQYFSETDETVALKTAAAIKNGFLPIVCVGETQEERESDKTKEVIENQVKTVFNSVQDITKTVIAYEPVWAIGTGLTASNEQAQEVHGFIRALIAEKYGRQAAEAVRILYGGSAKPANIGQLLDQPDIDGGLVGGASLKPESFLEMVQIAAKKVAQA